MPAHLASGNSTPVIDLQNVTKNFGKVEALRGLSLGIEPGEVHGFLGPNGAGKSTTIRILLGILRHDGGTVRLFGADPWHNAVALHRRLAYVPGDVELWPNLTGGEAIDLFARLRGGVNVKKRDELIERFDLDPRKKGRTYSKGNRQKVALISALAFDVELLLLDEPTAGLDPLMEAVFQECIREVKEAGHTVLLSSHILAQVEVLADRISIVRKGKIVETGTIDEIFYDPRHPYTWGLLSAMPDLDTADERLYTIPGSPPNLLHEKAGDAFAPRNKYALEIDDEIDPPMFKISDTHFAATWLLDPRAPKVEMPPELKDRVARMSAEAKKIEEAE